MTIRTILMRLNLASEKLMERLDPPIVYEGESLVPLPMNPMHWGTYLPCGKWGIEIGLRKIEVNVISETEVELVSDSAGRGLLTLILMYENARANGDLKALAKAEDDLARKLLECSDDELVVYKGVGYAWEEGRVSRWGKITVLPG
jgi:hypothetical protein